MESNITKFNYVPCPDWLRLIYDVIACITMCTSTLIFIVVVYIVVKKSPKEMGTYKWYILWNSSVTYLFEFLYGLCHPEPLLPYPIMVCLNFKGLSGDLEDFWIIVWKLKICTSKSPIFLDCLEILYTTFRRLEESAASSTLVPLLRSIPISLF